MLNEGAPVPSLMFTSASSCLWLLSSLVCSPLFPLLHVVNVVNLCARLFPMLWSREMKEPQPLFQFAMICIDISPTLTILREVTRRSLLHFFSYFLAVNEIVSTFGYGHQGLTYSVSQRMWVERSTRVACLGV